MSIPAGTFRSAVRLVAGLLLAAQTSAAVAIAQGVRPPAIRFTTDEAFDASTIPAYTGKHDDVYAHIDANVAAHLAHLQRWVRQPSVSAQSRGIPDMANLLAGDLRALGFTKVAVVPTKGHPGVFGFRAASAVRRTAARSRSGSR